MSDELPGGYPPTDETTLPSHTGSSYTGRPEPIPYPERRDGSRGMRMNRLLWVFGLLLLVYLAPWLIRRVTYAFTLGREQARNSAAIEGLDELDKLSLRGLSQASRLVAKKVGPSVVHIRTAHQTGGQVPGDEWAHLFSPQGQQQSIGQGSGVIVDAEQGYVVTNHHVIQSASAITVQLSDGREIVVKEVIGADVLTDIAVLKIEADNLIATPWGDSDQLETGDMVWALGSPFGLDHSVTFGIVSAKGRRGVTANPYQDFLQSDAAVNPGNSGGPLVNVHGEVIGINTAIVGNSYQGISFAIPSSLAKEVYEKLKDTGKVARGWLGVRLEGLTPEVRKQLSLPQDQGVLVRDVVGNSPAKAGGVERGDVILEWNGQPVGDPATLSRSVAATKIGSTGTLEVLRGNQQITLKITISERPSQFQ